MALRQKAGLLLAALALVLRGLWVREPHCPELWSTKALSPQLSLSALAVGSRVSQELHYTKEKLGYEAAYTSQMLIQTSRQEGENVLTSEALNLHLQAALTASKVQVSLYGK